LVLYSAHHLAARRRAVLAVTKFAGASKIIVILEGESLVNDATSFISFRFAVAAALTGAFAGPAACSFFVAAGGICVGLAVGWLATQVQKRLTIRQCKQCSS
jgi:CPA1 family monovalent cation:H+ antiporter